MPESERAAINVCPMHGETGNEPCAICFPIESNRTQFESCSEVVERLSDEPYVDWDVLEQAADYLNHAGGGPMEDRLRLLRSQIDSWRERRVQELEELVGKLRCENEWMLSLKPDELSYRNGTIAGWQQAHEPAACGHARGNWKDPKYGTPEYAGGERCEVCELVKALPKRKPDAELKRVLRAANERCNRTKCNHKRLHHVNGICRAGKPSKGQKSKCSCPAFQKADDALANSEQIRKGAKHE